MNLLNVGEFHWSTLRHIPQDITLQFRPCEDLKSKNLMTHFFIQLFI
jgi:hypothetical protein